MDERQFQLNELDPSKALDYMLGGKATLIIHSDTSGQDWRFRIIKKDEALWYVYDDLHYTTEGPVYLGFIRHRFIGTGQEHWFRASERFPNDSPQESIKYWDQAQFVLRECIRVLSEKHYPLKLHFFHTGHCSICGRELKDATSVRLGIGPKCGGRQ